MGETSTLGAMAHEYSTALYFLINIGENLSAYLTYFLPYQGDIGTRGPLGKRGEPGPQVTERL